jgi:hypothetical protein
MRIPSQVVNALSLIIGVPSGLLAAAVSQASSPNYHQLFVGVADLTIVCVICTAAFIFTGQGRGRFLLVPVAALAIAGCIEFGARLLGVRLIG